MSGVAIGTLEKKRSKITNTYNISGADDQNRTGDLLITNQLLYRLSYIGIHSDQYYVKKCCAIFILRGIPCQAITFSYRIHLIY